MFAYCQIRQRAVSIWFCVQNSIPRAISKLSSAIGNSSRSFQKGPSLRKASNRPNVNITWKRAIYSFGGLSGDLILVGLGGATSLTDPIVRIGFGSFLVKNVLSTFRSRRESICFTWTWVFGYRGLLLSIAARDQL